MKKIDIEEDFSHQKLAWKIKKIGFIVIFILVLLSAAGLFGTGFLSSSERGNKNYSWIDYERFTRAGSPAGFTLNLMNVKDSVLSFNINNKFLQNIKIERIMPLPLNETALSDETEFSFKVNPLVKKVLVKIDYTTDKPGLYDVSINFNNNNFTFKQLIYP